jgi:hypothetical protein
MAKRKVVLDLEEITQAEYDAKRSDPAHAMHVRDDGFLYHPLGDNYHLYVKHGDKCFHADDRGFDWQNWKNMKLEAVEFDPIAVYVEDFTPETPKQAAPSVHKPVLPGQKLPNQGTPAQNIERMKRGPKKGAAKGQRKRA